MAKQSINIGSSANDGTGDTIRAGMDKVNDNFTEIYAVNGGSAAFPSLGSAGQILQVNSGASALEFAAASTVIPHKIEGTNFTGSLIVGHSTVSAYLTSASSNTGVGIAALDAIVQGDSNTVVGNNAGGAITNGSFNTAIGNYALSTEDVHGANTAVGYSALKDQDAGANAYNVAIGYNAGHDVSTGVDNVIIGGEAGNSLTTGARNVFIGRRAAENAVGSDCIAIGDDAMAGGGGGGGNIAIGHEAFLAHVRTNSPGVEGDIAIGHEAGKTMAGAGSVSKVVLLGFQAGTVMTRTGASNSTVIGYQAGVAITSGNSNTIIGSNAGDALETGDNNIIIGHGAAASSTSVDNTITLGDSDINLLRIPGLGSSDGHVLTYSSSSGGIVLAAASSGVSGKVEGTNFTGSIIVGHSTTGTLSSAENNTALGIGALDAITQGDDNVAVGKDAGTALTTGTLNTLLGKDAGLAITTIHGTTALGHSAAKTQNNESYGTYVGYQAGKDCTGSQQTMIGGNTRAYNGGGDSNGMVAVGYSAQDVEGGVYATSVGYNAGNANAGANTVSIGRDTNRVNTQAATVSVGYQAGYSQTSGQANTNIGYQAGYANTTNGYRTMLGNEAGEFNTGANNTFIGYHAGTGASGSSTADRGVIIGSETGEALTSGSLNVFIGYQAGKAMTSGGSNVAIGSEALKAEDSRSFSVAVGTSALTAQDAGAHAYNTGLGHNAGNTVTTGVKNTCVGAKAGGDNSLITGSNNIVIGYAAAPSADDADNEITLGDANITAFRCADQSIAALSDARDKTNVKDSSFGLDFIDSIRPVEFEWDFRPENMAEAKQGKKRVGFIAQELQEAMPNGENEILDLVYEINEDRIEAKYGNLIPILVKAVQELKKELDNCKNNKCNV